MRITSFQYSRLKNAERASCLLLQPGEEDPGLVTGLGV